MRVASADKQSDIVMDMYKSGYTDEAIGRAIGVGKEMIRRFRNKHNLPPNSTRKIPFSIKQCNRIFEMHGHGYSDIDIAAEIGTNDRTIREFRINNHMPPNSFSPNQRAKLRIARENDEINFGEANRARMCKESWEDGWTKPFTMAEKRIAEILSDRRSIRPGELFRLLGYAAGSRPWFQSLLRRMIRARYLVKEGKTYKLAGSVFKRSPLSNNAI